MLYNSHAMLRVALVDAGSLAGLGPQVTRRLKNVQSALSRLERWPRRVDKSGARNSTGDCRNAYELRLDRSARKGLRVQVSHRQPSFASVAHRTERRVSTSRLSGFNSCQRPQFEDD